MNRILSTSLFLLLIIQATSGQAPATFNYQAVLRDGTGEIKSNTDVNIVVAIHQHAVDGAVVFSETHETITNRDGLVSLKIGSISDPSTINWADGPFYLNINVDGTDLGTSQLLSVPYAMHSATASSVSSLYVNGEYTAIFDVANTAGWKGFLSFTMINDIVKDIDFDYYNAGMERMSEVNNNGAMHFIPRIEYAISQTIIVPYIDSVYEINAERMYCLDATLLFAAALEAAKTGDPLNSVVSQSFNQAYKDGAYVASYDAFDSHGWKAFLEFTLLGDQISNVDFDEVNESGVRKSEDADYNEIMWTIRGITKPEIFMPQLEANIEAADITSDPPNAVIDAVTGATASSSFAQTLLDAALEAAVSGSPTEILVPQENQ